MSELRTVSEFVAAAEAGEEWADELVADLLGLSWSHRNRFASCRPGVPGYWLLYGEVYQALPRGKGYAWCIEEADGKDGPAVFLQGFATAADKATPVDVFLPSVPPNPLLTICVGLLLAKGKLKEES